MIRCRDCDPPNDDYETLKALGEHLLNRHPERMRDRDWLFKTYPEQAASIRLVMGFPSQSYGGEQLGRQ